MKVSEEVSPSMLMVGKTIGYIINDFKGRFIVFAGRPIRDDDDALIHPTGKLGPYNTVAEARKSLHEVGVDFFVTFDNPVSSSLMGTWLNELIAANPDYVVQKPAPKTPSVVLEMTVEQATALTKGVDFYNRMVLGQLSEYASFLKRADIPSVQSLGVEQHQEVMRHLEEIRELIGLGHGSVFGIADGKVPVEVRRAYEVMKALQQALAEHLDPDPSLRTVDYDGVTVRYTQDPLPVARVRLS